MRGFGGVRRVATFGRRVVGSELLAAANPVLRRVEERESSARTYVRKFPIVVKEAAGCTIVDTDGQTYLDFLGCAGTLALGHNHPVQNAAMRQLLDSNAPQQMLDLATPAKDTFVTELFSMLPTEMAHGYRVQFCGGSGSDAIDAAVKVCKTATGRGTVCAFHGAYHGHGQGPLAMMGNVASKEPVANLMPGVHFLPYPNNYRQPFRLPIGEGGEGEQAVMAYIENLLDDDESGLPKPACVILEVIQGEGGLNAMSNWALQELRRVTQERDIPLVVDEVQSGFCRSGSIFAFNASGIIPDVVVISKAAGGSQPLACIVYRNDLDVWSPGAHTGTFRGNQMAFAAGAATLSFMKETQMWESVAQKGALFQDLISAASSRYVGNVRGRGLMFGIELVDPSQFDKDGSPLPWGKLCAEVQAECFRRGLIIERGGRQGAVLRPLPPLIVTEDEIGKAAEILNASIEAAAHLLAA